MARPFAPPAGTRFFARVHSATCECPRCGRVLSFGQSRKLNATWDKRTARLTCPSCGLVSLVALLLWPVGGGQRTIPRDQVPNERQLAEMRAQASGWWLAEIKRGRRPDDSNITAGCSCRYGTEGQRESEDPQCPLHGRGSTGGGGV